MRGKGNPTGEPFYIISFSPNDKVFSVIANIVNRESFERIIVKKGGSAFQPHIHEESFKSEYKYNTQEAF